MLQLDLKTFF